MVVTYWRYWRATGSTAASAAAAAAEDVSLKLVHLDTLLDIDWAAEGEVPPKRAEAGAEVAAAVPRRETLRQRMLFYYLGTWKSNGESTWGSRSCHLLDSSDNAHWNCLAIGHNKVLSSNPSPLSLSPPLCHWEMRDPAGRFLGQYVIWSESQIVLDNIVKFIFNWTFVYLAISAERGLNTPQNHGLYRFVCLNAPISVTI